MARKRHRQPAGRASVFSAIVGIVLIALAVMVAVPVVFNWPRSWPVALAALALAGTGVTLIVVHISRHRIGKGSGYSQ